MKHSLDKLDSRLDTEKKGKVSQKTEQQKISKPKHRKRVAKKTKQIMKDIWDNIKWPNSHVTGAPEEQERMG